MHSSLNFIAVSSVLTLKHDNFFGCILSHCFFEIVIFFSLAHLSQRREVGVGLIFSLEF